MVVPTGTFQLTIQSGDKDVWSGEVNVPANQRVVVDASKGVRKNVPWTPGQKLGSVPRFSVGTASATVAVAKPTAVLSVSPPQLNCGDVSELKWTSSDAPQVEIAPLGAVARPGEQAIQTKQTTEYDLTAKGPGGTATASATVNVSSAIQAKLQLSPAEIHYKCVEDNVVEDSRYARHQFTFTASATI